MAGGKFGAALTRAWYAGSPWLLPLVPLGRITASVAGRRLKRFRARAEVPPVPVLVVGNITVGGTGKTPLVIALCRAATERGLKPVVISRGYGAHPPSLPWRVTPDQRPAEAGDEPLLIATATGVPVIIDPQRRRALEAAMALTPDLIISDDGLQHYALPRTAEIVVIDAARGLGNGRCLPAGPLREPALRLQQSNWIVFNGGDAGSTDNGVGMTLVPDLLTNAVSDEQLSPAAFAARYPAVNAVAGIGNPGRFFRSLAAFGLAVTEHAFSDHHAYTPADLTIPGEAPIVMTEKDLIKCQPFVSERVWVLPVTASLQKGFFDDVFTLLFQDQT
ncbi:MAG: tetraacyldisaccharide 4'-kinase [Alcanivorax sp.]|nr:tetraacyldisaccharide 4'-kinase [Alcanivorax sp.]